MKASTPQFSPSSAFSPAIDHEFRIEGNALHIHDSVTTNLDAYRWDAPGKVPVFFVFVADVVHIITLDEGEEPFVWVYTKNEKIAVMPISDDEVAMFAEASEFAHSMNKHGHA